MVGIASPLTPENPAPTPAPAPALDPAPSPAPASAANFRASAAQTMLGMAPLPVPQGTLGSAPVPPPTPDISPPSASAPLLPKGKTLLGVAPLSSPASATAPGASNNKKTLLGIAPAVSGMAEATPPVTTDGTAPVAHGKGKTLVGLAAPGRPSGSTSTHSKTLVGLAFSSLMAPLTLTVTEPEYVEEFYDEVVLETGKVERRVRRVQKPLPPLYKRPAFFVLLGALGVLGLGVAALLLTKKPVPVTARVTLNAEGHEVLHVTCASCPDGTKLTLEGEVPGEVKGHQADLNLSRRLKIGENALVLTVDRPEGGRDEMVKLSVPLAYRFNPDVNALQDTTPAVRVDVEALAGSSVTVGGKPVMLDAAGRGSTRIEVQEELLALPLEQKIFRKEIPYTIARKGSTPESGKLTVQVGVTPLTLDSPGSNLITDQATFLMAGRLGKGTGLTVSGTPIAVNPDGTFRQYLKIPGLGLAEVPLRASSHGMAPRLLSLKVKLVPSLKAEAKKLDASGRPGYDDVLGKLEGGAGMEVAWHGNVVSASAPGNQVIAIVNVATGCREKHCPARVVIPGGSALTTGETIGVYGRVIGITSDQDRKLPDVEADFIVKL
ncbi:MAG: hypothetical protein NZX77_00730 [Polyangiaceae bacterium]|nr:hypothetical protein [Polyangiaceae bacterium]